MSTTRCPLSASKHELDRPSLGKGDFLFDRAMESERFAHIWFILRLYSSLRVHARNLPLAYPPSRQERPEARASSTLHKEVNA